MFTFGSAPQGRVLETGFVVEIRVVIVEMFHCADYPQLRSNGQWLGSFITHNIDVEVYFQELQYWNFVPARNCYVQGMVELAGSATCVGVCPQLDKLLNDGAMVLLGGKMQWRLPDEVDLFTC